jgi:hypothetical protein
VVFGLTIAALLILAAIRRAQECALIVILGLSLAMGSAEA